MTLYSLAQLRALATNTGFPTLGSPSPALTISAIALTESNKVVDGVSYADSSMIGDLDRVDATWGPSYSLLQIRSLKAQLGTGGLRDAQKLPDPAFNMHSGFVIWQSWGNSFAPWSTYTSGAYKSFLQEWFPPAPGTYTVVAGDSISVIGQKTGYDWKVLAALNKLVSPYLLHIGQTLLLPERFYTVVGGDSLSLIGKRFNLSWSQIAALNGIVSPYQIYPGQVIKLPTVIM